MHRTISALLGVALLSVSAAAQTPATPAAAPAPDAPAVEAADGALKAAGNSPAPATAAAAGQGFSYTAEGRRDPFVPLLRGSGAATLATTAVVRAAGLAGLQTSEVTLRGVLASQGGYVAMVEGANDKTYIVRSGDRLADGTIRSITSRMLVIAQQVKDPLSRETEREVRKMLRQSEGTN